AEANRARRPSPTNSTRKPPAVPTIQNRNTHVHASPARPRDVASRGVGESGTRKTPAIARDDVGDSPKVRVNCGSCRRRPARASGRSQAGTSHSTAGTISAQPRAVASTRCRSAADRRRRSPFATRAPDTITDTLRALSSIFARLDDQLCDPIQFFLRQASPFPTEERGDRLLGGAVEERVHEMPQRRFPGGAPRGGGHIDVPQSLRLVPHVPLLFEHAQLGPYRGIAWIPWHIA